MTKTYLDEEGLSQVWNVIDARDTKVVEKLKNLEERMNAQENKASIASGVAYAAAYGNSAKPIVGTATEYTEESES